MMCVVKFDDNDGMVDGCRILLSNKLEYEWKQNQK